MKKLFLLLALFFFSIQGLAASCSQGSDVIMTVSPDGSYWMSSCATKEEISIQKEKILIQREEAFLKNQNLTADGLDHLIMESVKLGLSSLLATYDVDGNLLNRAELINELMFISSIMSFEEKSEMNQVLDDLPNLPEFRFDNVGLEYETAPIVAGAILFETYLPLPLETTRPDGAPDMPVGLAPGDNPGLNEAAPVDNSDPTPVETARPDDAPDMPVGPPVDNPDAP